MDEGPDFWVNEAHRCYDEIASLRAENERLRRCLEVFASDISWCECEDEYGDIEAIEWKVDCHPREFAADALRGGTSDD